MSLTALQEVPQRTLMIITGAPGAGKSTFCQQVALRSMAAGKPVIFVTTERSLPDLLGQLREGGMGEDRPSTVYFVDAFTETVGLAPEKRPDTLTAHCADLNSLSIAVTKLKQRIGSDETLLVVDSLTSPYLFAGQEIIRFSQLFLSKFAAEGNVVLAIMDEGCGRQQDLVAIQSIADSILRMATENSTRTIHVVKHPATAPTKLQIPIEAKPTSRGAVEYNPEATKKLAQFLNDESAEPLRTEIGDFLHPFWPNLAHWSGMLWDPIRFPKLIYDLNWEDTCNILEALPYMPLRFRIMIRTILLLQSLNVGIPQRFDSVDQIQNLVQRGIPYITGGLAERSGRIEYLSDVSSPEEHYFRIHENSDCCGFENIGTAIGSHIPPAMAGMLSGFEKLGKDWNAIETKCVGLGDPYCEIKLARGEFAGFRESLKKDNDTVERIHNRLMDQLLAFLAHDQPLPSRPSLGDEVHIHVAFHAMGFPHLGGARYRMAIRMGGARSGREIGNRLKQAGVEGDDAIQRVLYFLNHCKVGKATLNAPGDRLRIQENVESIRTQLFLAYDEPSCDFTTGFLSGLFSSLKDQRVREIKCVAAGDPHCEWEIL